MFVPGPQRDDEGVAFLPVEGFAVDHGRATAAEGVVDAGAGVAVGFGFFVGAEHLDLTRHRRHRRAAGGGIDEFQSNAVVGIARCARQTLQ